MPPASNGNTNYVPPMPMPSTQAYPSAPMTGYPMPMPNTQAYPSAPMTGYPMTGYPMTGYPMVQPIGYPPANGPMMGAPYGAGYGGTTYGPAPSYWNPNYRGY